jgi:hypothetical protein
VFEEELSWVQMVQAAFELYTSGFRIFIYLNMGKMSGDNNLVLAYVLHFQKIHFYDYFMVEVESKRRNI